ncbi:MAG: hypothetical protein D6687_10940 [Acidobacteria bacterium]|jgi:hypothetical protein|nr:MAG: hypothetical protein D6687_10940 [Acidobacteriota bacterium]GIU81377.1 MAG: hypothetical protein KatS3mg006_0441 [Pyrinomonadaceae bacterium]
MTTKKIKVIKKGAIVEDQQKNNEKNIKTAEIALKISNWIEDFYKRRKEDRESLAMFVEEEVSKS